METKLCKCGCGQKIIIKPAHKYSGIPSYLPFHKPKSKAVIERNKIKVECACGCGQELNKYDKYGKKRSFIRGHNLLTIENRLKTKNLPKRIKDKFGRFIKTKIQKRIFCACGCGEELNKYDRFGKERRYKNNHGNSSEEKRKRQKEMVKCACGCGENIKKYTKCGIRRRYVQYHYSKVREWSEEIKNKISLGNTGRITSEESSKKMSTTRKKLLVSPRGEKLLKNILPYIGIGKYETEILDILENCFGYKIIRQYTTLRYFLDGYCPILNLAIEVDGRRHFDNKGNLKTSDVIRQKEIEEKLGCQFLRIKVMK